MPDLLTYNKRTDVLTPEQRSRCMSNIRGHDTKPEIRLRKALWATGLRYRLRSDLFGRPDMVFGGKRVAVFVDGCFWHGCPEHCNKPKTNREFWETKISKNMLRDLKVTERLTGEGWTVIRIWEHEIRQDIDAVVKKILSSLNKPS